MGIGRHQGGTRVPPDHPEGGAGGELYLEGLWRTAWGECGMRNAECGVVGQSRPKPQWGECRRKKDECRNGRQSRPKPHQSQPKARRKPPPSLLIWCTDRVRLVYGYCTDGVRSHLLATPKPPQGSHKAPTKPGTCEVQARCEPGNWEGIGRCKPSTCVVDAWYKPHPSHPGGRGKPGNWADAPCAPLELGWGFRSQHGVSAETVPGIDSSGFAAFQRNQRRISHLHRRKTKGEAARGSGVRLRRLRAPYRGRRRDWGRARCIPGLRTTRHPR